MCDGTIVLGCTELDGSSPDNSDFDAQSGHLHDLVDEGWDNPFYEPLSHSCLPLKFGITIRVTANR